MPSYTCESGVATSPSIESGTAVSYGSVESGAANSCSRDGVEPILTESGLSILTEGGLPLETDG